MLTVVESMSIRGVRRSVEAKGSSHGEEEVGLVGDAEDVGGLGTFGGQPDLGAGVLL